MQCFFFDNECLWGLICTVVYLFGAVLYQVVSIINFFGISLSTRLDDKMPSSELSKNDSFYQLACHTTDTFTSCIRLYEDLLPYFEADKPGESVSKRLFNIGDMLTLLYSELTTLKNEITTPAVVFHNNKVSEPSVESKDVTQVVSECSQQENIICEASTVEEQKVSHKKKELDKLPRRSWEDIRQVPGEGCQGEKVSNKDNKIEKTISQDEKVHLKPSESLKNQASDFSYKCENCNEIVTVYNQDLALSVALHQQDGCCRGKPSKLIAVQKERKEKKVDTVSVQGQVQNMTKCQETSYRPNLTPPQLDTADPRFSCLQPVGNGFICTVCHKKLSGAKNFVEHVEGNYHQVFLNEIRKNAQSAKSFENKSLTSVEQEGSIPSINVELAKIIKSISGQLYRQRKYLSVGKDVIICNLCDCSVPPTYMNVRDHVLGSRHSKKEAEIQPPN